MGYRLTRNLRREMQVPADDTGIDMDTNDWLASYQQDVANVAQRAEQARAQLQEVAATLSSADGAVTVTVNASGALQSLSFGSKADELPRPQLAQAVVATARRAQAQAAQQVTAAMAPLIGTDSEAMQFLQEQIPEPEEPDEQGAAANTGDRFVLNEEQAEQRSTRPEPAAPPRPPRRPRPAPSDDEGFDEGFGSIFGRE